MNKMAETIRELLVFQRKTQANRDWTTWSQILRWILKVDAIVIGLLIIAYWFYRAKWPH